MQRGTRPLGVLLSRAGRTSFPGRVAREPRALVLLMELPRVEVPGVEVPGVEVMGGDHAEISL
jgi:hypothetical protein